MIFSLKSYSNRYFLQILSDSSSLIIYIWNIAHNFAI